MRSADEALFPVGSAWDLNGRRFVVTDTSGAGAWIRFPRAKRAPEWRAYAWLRAEAVRLVASPEEAVLCGVQGIRARVVLTALTARPDFGRIARMSEEERARTFVHKWEDGSVSLVSAATEGDAQLLLIDDNPDIDPAALEEVTTPLIVHVEYDGSLPSDERWCAELTPSLWDLLNQYGPQAQQAWEASERLAVFTEQMENAVADHGDDIRRTVNELMEHVRATAKKSGTHAAMIALCSMAAELGFDVDADDEALGEAASRGYELAVARIKAEGKADA